MDSVASRYAIALLSVARDENKVQLYVNEVEQLIDILDENKDIFLLLNSYALKNVEKKQIINECFKGKIEEYILNLMYVLIDNLRCNCMNDVFHEFIKIALKELNIRRGIIYTTITLSEKQILKMEKKVSKLLNANVTLKNQLDENMIGGFKIKIDDYLIDDSINNRLEKLKETITLKKGELTDGN